MRKYYFIAESDMIPDIEENGLANLTIRDTEDNEVVMAFGGRMETLVRRVVMGLFKANGELGDPHRVP